MDLSAKAQADRLIEQGKTVSHDPNQLNVACQLFSSATLAAPHYSQAWYWAGTAAQTLGRNPAAMAHYERSLQCSDIDDVTRGKIYANYAWILHEAKHPNEALKMIKQAVELVPMEAQAWLNSSCIHGTLRHPKVATEHAQKAIALGSKEPAQMALAFSYLFDGQYAKGLEAFECRFAYKLHHFLHYPYPPWTGERDKCIFVVYDQGLGDTLSYARFIEEVCRRSRYVHVSIQPELFRWFSTAFAHIKNINLISGATNFPGDADFWTTFVSLPFALHLTDDEIKAAPNIRLPPMQPQPQWLRQGADFHIGVAWSGSPANDIDKHRKFPLEHLLSLYEVPGIQLYSLQMDDARQDMNVLGVTSLVEDMSKFVRDVSDTMSILPKLDLVITCESSVGHMCGAANFECWIPYSFLGRDYRLGPTGEKPLWYKKHRTFNQGVDCRWEPVFDEVRSALAKKVRNAKRSS